MNSFCTLLILYVLQITSRHSNARMMIPGITSVDYYDRVISAPKNAHSESVSLRYDEEEILSERWKPNSSAIHQQENIVEIPEEVYKNLGSITDLNELQQVLGIQYEPEVSFAIRLDSESDGNSPKSRSKNTDQYLNNPQQAHCEPEPKSVDLGLINTNAVTYYPTCVRVKQCGGCCPNKDVISCQPVASDKVTVKVLKLATNNHQNLVSTQPTRSRRRRNSIRVQYNTINVTVEEHKQCECLCKLRENDCDISIHLYDEKSCACHCMNTDEEEKCVTKSTHIWKKETCQCLCRYEITCSSSEQFDHNTCTCISTSIRLSLNNVLLRKAQPLEQVYRHRKPSQALKLDGQLCKDMGILTFGFGRCRIPVR